VVAAERLGDKHAQATAHRGLANALGSSGDFDDADVHLQHALELFAALDYPAGQAHTHIGLGWLLARQGHLHQALDNASKAHGFYQIADDIAGQANALNNVGWY
jgi:Flp pilus assembly protein TadD